MLITPMSKSGSKNKNTLQSYFDNQKKSLEDSGIKLELNDT